jgi:hypothetical protein
MLTCKQNNWKLGKYQDVVGEEIDPMIQNKTFTKFNIVVDEVAYTDSQKRLQFQQLVQLGQLGVPVPSKLYIENSPLIDKKQLVDAVAEQEMMAQRETQVQQQLQTQRQIIENENLMADVKSKQSLAVERLNKANLDTALSAERITQAQANKTKANLDLVETALRLQSLDLSNLKELLSVLETIKTKIEPEQDLGVEKINQQLSNVVSQVPGLAQDQQQ